MQKLSQKPGDTVVDQVQKTGGDKENNVQNRKSTGSSPTTATTTGTTPQQVSRKVGK